MQNGTMYYYAVSAVNAVGGSLSTEGSARPEPIINPGFEGLKISGHLNNPLNAGWRFSAGEGHNGSGLTTNGSGYTGANPGKIPQGEQAAYLQGTGTISQTLGGLTPGSTYTLAFSAAQRVSSNRGGQTWQVKLDDKVIGEYSPDQTATAYTKYTAKFQAPAKSHVVSFVGTNARGGDNTVFIDDVRLTQTSQ